MAENNTINFNQVPKAGKFNSVIDAVNANFDLAKIAILKMKGKSAYEIWLEQDGNEGKSLDDFWRYLTADKGYKKIPLASESNKPSAEEADQNAIYVYPKTGDSTKSVAAVSNGTIWIELFEINGNIADMYDELSALGTNINILDSTKVDKNSSNETTIKDSSSYDSYTDADGNEVFRIGEIPDVGKGVQASDYFDAEGHSLVEQIENTKERLDEMEDKDNQCLPLRSNVTQTVIDGAASEIWCDKNGKIGMKLGIDGTLYVSRIVCESLGNDIVNAFAIPSFIYTLHGIQRNIWHQSVLARWNPYDYYLKFGGSATFQRRTNLVASLKNTKADGDDTDKTIEVSLIDNKRMKITQIKTCTIKEGVPNDENLSPIKVSFIGSSTVQLLYFEYALTHYVSNYTLIGLRHKQGSTTILHEGRGGASLYSYCEGSYNTGSTSHFFPFWQPIGNFRFWGATGFWINAHINADDGSFNDTGGYYTGLYVDSALEKFDASTGWLVNPTNGDIMYDTTTKTYKLYNGSEWVSTSKANYSWTFDYGKYLSMWGLYTPDVICITLGANDFREASLPLDFVSWKRRMDGVIASIHNVSSSIKIVLCNQGPFSNHGYQGDATALMNYKMWLHLDFMIKTYGDRENENIFVLAQGSEISAEYGFNVSTNQNIIKPTEIYDGTERMLVHSGDVVHPYKSLDNMGTPIAAFLQYIRK